MQVYRSLASVALLAVAKALPTTVDVRDNDSSFSNTQWDIIVVGAGPAGLVVSDRMSEAGMKTLLLEQGGPSYYSTGGRERPGWLNSTDLSRVDVPGLYKSIYSDPGQSLLCNSTQLNAYAGCTIGGCTAINAGLFFQPPASDFDTYFPDGWKSRDVQSAISKLRAKQPFTDQPSKDGEYYVQSGYTAAKEWLVNGVGYKEVVFNDTPDNKTGVFGRTSFDYVGGQRSGPVKTYLETALARQNFRFEHGVTVRRVERDGNRATAVVATVNGIDTSIQLSQKGRVILSGGALSSPGLLMRSGIGDPVALANMTKNGVLSLPSSQWINNSATGVGLFDNPNSFVILEGESVQSYTYSYSSPVPADRDLYLKDRSGPYAFASETAAFWDVIEQDGHKIGLQGTIDSAGYAGFSSNKSIALNVYGTSGLGSTGKVVVDDRGVAGPNGTFFYTAKRDAPAIAKFIKKLFDGLVKSQSGLKPLNIPIDATTEEIEKYITTPSAYTLGKVNHWSSSCRVGECTEIDARVKGTDNIHVVDASLLPPLTTNLAFGIMVAAERASELILAGQAAQSG